MASAAATMCFLPRLNRPLHSPYAELTAPEPGAVKLPATDRSEGGQMHTPIRSYLRSAALIGTGAALTVAGVALANGGSGSGAGDPTKTTGDQVFSAAGPPVDPNHLTYAEFHLIDHGQAKVIRLDAGKVVSASDSSITVGENDGNQVTIPVDDNTKVIAGPCRDVGVGDLKQGQQVNVFHPEGGGAQTIMLSPKPGALPKPGDLPKRLPRPGELPRGFPKPSDLPKGAIVHRGPGTVRVMVPARAGKSGAPRLGAGFAIAGQPPACK
jgi:hypothetical protein